MKHLTDSEIIRLVACELSPGDTTAARAHIESCSECAAREREQEQLWAMLGAWETTRAARDMTASVLTRVDAESAEGACERPHVLWRRVRWAQVGRIAAALLVAAGAGHAVGRWVGPRERSDSSAVAPVSAEDVAASLGLDAFASAPVGFDELLSDSPDETDAERGQS